MTTDTTAQARLELAELAPDLYRAMIRLDDAVGGSGLDASLQNLIKTRASQLNGCAYCIDMHTKDARAAGESEQRLYSLDAWRETPFYSARERAALELTEAITLLSETHVPEEVWQSAAEEFEPAELAALVFAATTINAWNRLGVSTRMVPGRYEPAA
jgi:AhpD family alkylhydroperoxidase